MLNIVGHISIWINFEPDQGAMPKKITNIKQLFKLQVDGLFLEELSILLRYKLSYYQLASVYVFTMAAVGL